MSVASAVIGALRAPSAPVIPVPPALVSKSTIQSRSTEREVGLAYTFVTEQIVRGGLFIDRIQGMTDYASWTIARPVQISAGWPFRCVIASWPTQRRTRVDSIPDRLSTWWRHGIPYGESYRFIPGAQRRRFPIRPVWLGLVGNIVCYYLLLFAVTLSISSSRTLWRRRRHLCPKCAYPICRPRCPECGYLFGNEMTG